MTAEGDIPLDMELRGSMDVVVDGGTHNGFVNLRLTSGVIDWQAEEIFGRAHCHRLAGAVATLTGWEAVSFEVTDPSGRWRPTHCGVLTPEGNILDIFGVRSIDEVENAYSRLNSGAPIRYRKVSNTDIPGGVIERFHDRRGDRCWWGRDLPDAGRAMYQHFARLVLRRHSYGEHLTSHNQRPQNAEQTPPKQRAGQRRKGHRRSRLHRSKGAQHNMIDDIAAATSQAQQQITESLGTLQQVNHDLESTRGLLAQTWQGSQQTETSEALGSLGQALERLDEARQLAQTASNATESYAARL